MEQICKTLLKSHIHFIQLYFKTIDFTKTHHLQAIHSNSIWFGTVKINIINSQQKKITFLKSSSQLFNDDFINSKIRF